jgi:TonB family protein
MKMKQVTKVLSILLVLLFVTEPVTSRAFPKRLWPEQSASTEWQRYRVDGEDVSVLLPFMPAMQTIDVSYEKNKYRRERTLAVYVDGVVFVMATFEKKGISFDEVVQKTGPCAPTQSIRVDGVAGKMCNVEVEKAVRTIEWFATDTIIYTFSAVADKMEDHSAVVAKFFSSISFGPGSKGMTVSDGPGAQPLAHENGARTDSIFRSSELDVRARIVSKPEPQYTEAARMSQVTGTVVVRAIFSMSGAVEDVTIMRGLPDGLTEKAISAARQIRFIPAIKGGRFVSMRMQLEYNFNLY